MNATEINLIYFSTDLTLKTQGNHLSTEISNELIIKSHHHPHLTTLPLPYSYILLT